MNNKFIFIPLSLFFQSLSVILGKYASLHMKDFSLLSIITNPFYVAVIICLGLQALCWQVVLKYFNLSFAYIFINLLYVVILGASFFLFKEIITVRNVIGCFIIVVGIVIFNIRDNKT